MAGGGAEGVVALVECTLVCTRSWVPSALPTNLLRLAVPSTEVEVGGPKTQVIPGLRQF